MQRSVCWRGITMTSLKAKILWLITLIIILVVSAAAYFNLQQQRQIINGISDRGARVLTETIKTAIADVMRSGHTADVGSIFARIKSQNHIRSLRIVDQDGFVMNSADIREVGNLSPTADLTVIRSGTYQTFQRTIPRRFYHSFTPIFNGPQCSNCHSSTQLILGVLEMEMSLEYLNVFLEKGKRQALITTAVIVAVLILFIALFLTMYVDKPVRRLLHGMGEVERGKFELHEEITSSREMNLLSSQFNRMVGRLKKLMDSTVVQEVELAKAEEKLSHHHEMHQMNLRLAEHIKEIESLNASLEERIEEIEGANYKIADLAGELEDKNYNLEKAVAKLSTLYKVGLGISSVMELDRLFNLIVKTTMETLQAQIGYIVQYSPKQSVLRLKALHGLGEASADGHLIPMKPTGVAAWVIKNRKPLLITDINDMPEFDRFSLLGFERKTLVAAPLAAKDGIIGTITVVNKLDNTVYTNEDLELLSTIAAQASIAITNARLYEEQQKTYMNTIHALVSAIEANDSYTRGHSERVTRYSLQLGARLGLSEDRLKIIERAGILHDIGKIGIDRSLLNKEGLLSADEMSQLQQHPAIGMKILEPIEFLQDVRLCIGQHHERYDGEGYPGNTPADDQLLESRILAIADSYDAMTSDRPYRKALSREVALAELQKNAGTQFDPVLVSHFVEMIDLSTTAAGRDDSSQFVSTSAA